MLNKLYVLLYTKLPINRFRIKKVKIDVFVFKNCQRQLRKLFFCEGEKDFRVIFNNLY